jgi:outer membrane protein assembly factor BamB
VARAAGGGRGRRDGPARRVLAALVAVAGAAALGAVAWASRAVPAGTVARGCVRQDGPPRGAVGPTAAVGLGSWTTFAGSPGHDLVLPAADPAGRPFEASWTFRTDGELSAPPSVVGGVVYLASLDHCVYALDAATGQELWAFRADNEVMSEPLVVDGRVFFGSGDKVIVTRGGETIRGQGPSAVYALDAATGRLLWRFPTRGEVMPTLLYADGALYAADGSGTFYALDPATGRLLWQVAFGSIDSMSSPTLAGDTAVLGGAGPYAFYGIDLATHRVLWRTLMGRGSPWDAEGGIDDVTPAVSGHVALVQNPEGIYPHATVVEFALDTRTGAILWQKELGQGTVPVSNREEVGVATVAGGDLYVGTPAVPGLWAMRVSDGAPVWQAPARIPIGVRAPPTVTARHVLVAGSGWVWVLDRLTGAVLGGVRLSGPGQMSCALPPVTVVGQTVLAVAGQGDGLVAMPLPELLARAGAAPSVA